MNARPRILIVDDDEDILDLLRYNLVKEGYVVKTLSRATDAISVAAVFRPHLIVLDLMMPVQNGIDICRKLRSDTGQDELYIFFLTAKSDDYFKHAVFNVGGDDFIEKIVGLKPLITKISAVLKHRYVIRKRLMKVKIGSIELYRGVETVYKDGNKVMVTKTEFEILFFLAQNAGRKINIHQLIQSLWGSTVFIDEGSVRRSVNTLAEKLDLKLFKGNQLDTFKLSV